MPGSPPHWRGLRILNTRPLGQNQALSQAIREAGGIPVECPALAIHPVENDWWQVLGDLASIDWAIFTSTNAVQFFFEKQTSWPESIRVAAVGQATANALQRRGVRVDDLPLSSSSEGLLNLEALQQVQGKRVLLVKGEKGRTLLADTLTERGAIVHQLAVYYRALPVVNPLYIASLWQDDAIDAVVFTSGDAMQYLFQMFGSEARDWLCRKPCWVQSHRLAKVAADLGIITIMVDDFC